MALEVWLPRDLRPRCPDERLCLRAAVRVVLARDPAVRRDVLRPPDFRAADLRAPVLRAPVLRAPVLRAPVLRPPALRADLRDAPALDRDAAAPPRFDELFLRPPPLLRPDFDFALAIQVLLKLRLTGARPRAIYATGRAERMFHARQESNVFWCCERNHFGVLSRQRSHRRTAFNNQQRRTGNECAKTDHAGD